MALGTPVAGAAVYTASGSAQISPAYPAGILSTDVVLLFLGQKPSVANGGTATTPTGWTLREELLAAGGYGTTLGVDTGNTNLRIYSWDTPITGQTGTRPVATGNSGVAWAFIVRIPTGGGALSYGSATGQQTTAPGTSMSVALTNGTSATDFQAGDKAIWAMCIPTDVTTPAQFSAQAVTATGATFATAVELNEPDTTLGNDLGGYSAYAHVNSGSSTTAPTVTTTIAGTLTNVRGPVVLLRVRETTLPVDGTLAVTDGADVLSADGVLTNTGTSSTTDGADVGAFDGELTNTGASTTTDGADVGAFDGELTNTGTSSTTDGADVLAANAVLTNTGASTTTDGADVLSASGTVSTTATIEVSWLEVAAAGVVGTLTSTDGADVIAANAVLTNTGTSTTTDGADVLAANAVLTNTGTSTTTDGADVLNASGTASLNVTGTIATTDGADVLNASGSLILAGTLNTTDGTDIISFAGLLTNTGSIAKTDGADTPAFNGAISVSGTISTTDGADTPSFSGAVSVNGTISTTDGADTPSFTGNLSNAGSLAYLNGADTISMSGSVSAITVTGTLNFVEGSGVNLDGLILYDIEYGRFVKVLNNYLVVTLQ